MEIEILMHEAIEKKCACSVCQKLRKEAFYQMELNKASLEMRIERQRLEIEKTIENIRNTKESQLSSTTTTSEEIS
jgi:hypothetical protein